MQMRTLRTWGFRAGGVIAGLIVLAAAALFFLTLRTVDRIYGGETRIVDPDQFQVESGPIAITHVSVLSPDGSQMLPDRTVLVRDGRTIPLARQAGACAARSRAHRCPRQVPDPGPRG